MPRMPLRVPLPVPLRIRLRNRTVFSASVAAVMLMMTPVVLEARTEARISWHSMVIDFVMVTAP